MSVVENVESSDVKMPGENASGCSVSYAGGHPQRTTIFSYEQLIPNKFKFMFHLCCV